MVVAAIGCGALLSLIAPCAAIVAGPIAGVLIVEVLYGRAIRRAYDTFAAEMQCTACGYPLHASVARAPVGRCPECGADYDAATYQPPGGTDALRRDYEQRVATTSPPES